MNYRNEKSERKYEQNEWNENKKEYNEELKNFRSKIYQPVDKVSSGNK